MLLNYNLEAGRLDTFVGDWPHADNSTCSKTQMSKAGFYYTGKRDCVRCYVCQVKLEDWNPQEDEPWKKHAEAAPGCEFAKMAKEEGKLTVEEWLDVFCDQAIHKLELKLKQLHQI
jgi:baculoviral IAP repeat-containing protein 1